nr:hypothetical protein [Tanacetum cinerariifolium]
MTRVVLLFVQPPPTQYLGNKSLAASRRHVAASYWTAASDVAPTSAPVNDAGPPSTTISSGGPPLTATRPPLTTTEPPLTAVGPLLTTTGQRWLVGQSGRVWTGSIWGRAGSGS